MAKRSSKNKKIRLAAIAAALSTGGIVIALSAPANAESGRRICQYGPTRDIRDANGQTTGHFAHVMDYKKNGFCPKVNNELALRDGLLQNPRVMRTCESLQDEMRADWDPCVRMTDDHVYRMEWHSHNGGFHQGINFGHY